MNLSGAIRSGDVRSRGRGLATLRRLAKPPVAAGLESCDLCSAPLAARHDHLFDPRARQLRCACQACAILFSANGETTWRRTPRDVRGLRDLKLSGRMWAALGIPIGLAFLFKSSITGEAVAIYPSPAGPTETELDRETWDDLVAENPPLAAMLQDVEALLINRINGAREYFMVPIDECYKLTGIVRKYWRGFSGGEEAWEQIREFFDDLKSQAGEN
jgi:hypothetical protein